VKKFTVFLCTMSLVFGVAVAASATTIPAEVFLAEKMMRSIGMSSYGSI